jgi:hypothetical protein
MGASDPRAGELQVCGEAPCAVRPDEAVLIARSLGLPLGSFVELTPACGAGYRLSPDTSAPERALALRKVEGPEPGGRACVFALALPLGRRACGLGSLAPATCGTSGGRHLAADEAAALAEGVRGRWHAALALGAYSMPCDVFFEFLFDALPDHWPPREREA